MQSKLHSLAAFFFLFSCLGHSLNESSFDPKANIVTRNQWGAKAAKESNDPINYPTKIIIGHTVSVFHQDHVLAVSMLQKNQMSTRDFDDIGYHFILDSHGQRFDGRSLDKDPCILIGHNKGSCGVGILGRCDKHEDAINIDIELLDAWGKHLGLIAYELGIKNLVHKENIFGMSDLAERFPISPGQHFMSQFPEMLEIANDYLSKQNNP